jgi:Fic family protein
VSLQLIQDGVLPSPVLNLSTYIEKFKSEYYERLQAVRERGQLDEWVNFFARAIATQAKEGVVMVRQLLALQEKYRNQIVGDRSGSRDLIDVLFANPIVTVKRVQHQLKISQPSASSLLKKAENAGWISLLERSGRGGKQTWFAHEIWKAITKENW